MTCSRQDECESTVEVGCKGCGFKHFDQIESNNNQAIEFIKNEYFNLCSLNRRGPGGRVSLDSPFKKFILEQANQIIQGFPGLKALKPNELTDKIIIDHKEYEFQIKCDGAFSFSPPDKNTTKYIFVEIKGYGDDTNSILSAITAAQLSCHVEKFKNHKYYYLGSNSAKATTGLKREDHFLNQRYKVATYIKWAESKRFIKFYGILDLEEMLNDIRQYCEDA
ncbi:MAG: hypothetical protein DRP65_07485 [Planctomycetota bacterium]|nr:MAG: hypothetical protein DRP65_07485 [Planctomycetota bacterium]